MICSPCKGPKSPAIDTKSSLSTLFFALGLIGLIKSTPPPGRHFRRLCSSSRPSLSRLDYFFPRKSLCVMWFSLKNCPVYVLCERWSEKEDAARELSRRFNSSVCKAWGLGWSLISLGMGSMGYMTRNPLKFRYHFGGCSHGRIEKKPPGWWL